MQHLLELAKSAMSRSGERREKMERKLPSTLNFPSFPSHKHFKFFLAFLQTFIPVALSLSHFPNMSSKIEYLILGYTFWLCYKDCWISLSLEGGWNLLNVCVLVMNRRRTVVSWAWQESDHSGRWLRNVVVNIYFVLQYFYVITWQSRHNHVGARVTFDDHFGKSIGFVRTITPCRNKHLT